MLIIRQVLYTKAVNDGQVPWWRNFLAGSLFSSNIIHTLGTSANYRTHFLSYQVHLNFQMCNNN